MPVSASRVSRSSGALAAPPAVTHLPRARARLLFAYRLRAGAGRRSGSGWRQGRVRWGRPLLSRPRGAVDSGPAAVLAAVESAAVSAVAWSCGCVVGFGWMVVRFVCVIRVPACARVSRVSRVCPGSPGVFLPLLAHELVEAPPRARLSHCTSPHAAHVKIARVRACWEPRCYYVRQRSLPVHDLCARDHMLTW